MAEADNDDNLTPEEMRQWLEGELRDLTKALELRVRDATDFVTAYAVGKLTPKKANERFILYSSRWGEAINGMTVSPDMSDDEIVRRLDRMNRLDRDVGPVGRWQRSPSKPSR